MFWPRKVEKINYLSHKDKDMGDNMRKIVYRTLPYTAASLTMLWHHVDPKHSVVSSFLCTCTWIGTCVYVCRHQADQMFVFWLQLEIKTFRYRLPGFWTEFCTTKCLIWWVRPLHMESLSGSSVPSHLVPWAECTAIDLLTVTNPFLAMPKILHPLAKVNIIWLK